MPVLEQARLCYGRGMDKKDIPIQSANHSTYKYPGTQKERETLCHAHSNMTHYFSKYLHEYLPKMQISKPHPN